MSAKIVHMARKQAGEMYPFDFVPQGKERESGGAD
jgi:hypothetical protein